MKKELQLAVGDLVRWTKNSKTNESIVNGGEARVTKVSERKITLEMADGSKIKMNKSDPDLQHIDYNYSSTTYGAQGATVDHVIGVARAREQFIDLTNQRSLYVTLSRARHSATIFTENKDALARSLGKKTGAKTSALEHQQEKQLTAYPVDLSKQGREIFIGIQKSPDIKTFFKNEQSFENFVSNPSLIRDTAEKIFGDANAKLSKHHQLRFGNKGSVSVNLQNGQWYDFSSGEGGNLYKFCKNETILERKSDKEQIKTNGQSAMQKLITVEKITKNSISGTNFRASILQKYFSEYRKINLKEILLSGDLRFSEKVWNSEKKKYMPAVIAVAGKNGKTNAVQVIYLDPKTADKARDLDVSKRSIGIVKGSFVELTKNINSNTVFIAEGVETALSVAQTEPDARVICSLGISNIKNIELKNKNVVICADNDGPNSHTNMVIERAAAPLKENGAKSVTIIRPEMTKADFNDVLKTGGKTAVQQYTTIAKHNPKPLFKEILHLKQSINHHKINELANKELIFANYKDLAKAIAEYDKLKQKLGTISATKMIKQSPKILGKLNGGIFNNTAKENVQNNAQKLIKAEMHKKLHTLQQTNLQKLDAKLHDIIKLVLSGEKSMAHALHTLHNSADHAKVTWFIARFNELTNHSNKPKAKSFIRTLHEMTRKNDLQKYAESNQHLDRLVAIDYNSPNIARTLATFKLSEQKIHTLTQEYMSQGMSQVKASFVATEIVKHHDKHGTHMPTKQIDFVKNVGDYVHKNYNDLRSFGFSHKEAAVTFNEGSTIIKQSNKSCAIAKSDIKQIQIASKQQLENKLTQNFAVKNHQNNLSSSLEI